MSAEKLTQMVEALASQAGRVPSLQNRVRTLTRQRDQANARNAELRAKLAQYQQQLSDLQRSKA